MQTQYIQTLLFDPLQQCRKCKELLPCSEFYRSRNRSGVSTICKACDREQARQWRQNNPEKVREQHRREKERHPDRLSRAVMSWAKRNPEKVKEIRSRYITKHGERIRAEERARKAVNPDHVKKLRREQVARKPDHYKAVWRAASQRRNARKKGNGGVLTGREWMEILNHFGNKCLACGATEDITIDHVIPIACGGRNEASIVQPLCRSCNSSKGAKTIDYRH